MVPVVAVPSRVAVAVIVASPAGTAGRPELNDTLAFFPGATSTNFFVPYGLVMPMVAGTSFRLTALTVS